MKADDYRAPVGRQVVAMEPVRQNRNQGNRNGLCHRHNHEPFHLNSPRCGICRRKLFAELAAFANEINRAGEQEHRRESERGSNQAVERLRASQAPPQPSRAKHRHNQCTAARVDQVSA